MNNKTTNNTADMAIAYLSDEAKKTVAKLMASGDKELQIIARLIITEKDYQTLKSLV
jgi:hypothetical protein